MACCMLGLLLVYQCIDAFARLRARVLKGQDAVRKGLGWLGAPAGLARRLVLVASVAFSAGLASAATVEHAGHLARDASAVGQITADWCRGLIPGSHTAPEKAAP